MVGAVFGPQEEDTGCGDMAVQQAEPMRLVQSATKLEGNRQNFHLAENRRTPSCLLLGEGVTE